MAELSEGEPETFNIMEVTIKDMQKAMDKGIISSIDLVQMYLEKISNNDKVGPCINSLININPKSITIAKALDEERKEKGPRGLLHGIPIILKDNIDTVDMPTTGGSKVLTNSIPSKDAFLTRKLKEAGAVILAKANLSEFARGGITVSSLGGQTRNPYDLTRTPGGSSGGTGAAIAANFAAAGIGTDTVNSIRSPASANSLIGMRPTMGLVSRNGIIPNASTQDMAGPITRTVEDAAIILDNIAGYDPLDPETAWNIGNIPKSYTDYLNLDGVKGKRLGIVKTLFGYGPDYWEVNNVMSQAIKELEQLGAEIVYIDVPALDSEKVLRECHKQLYESTSLVNEYLASLGPNAPVKTVEEIIASGDVHPWIEKELKEAQSINNPLELPEYKERLLRRLALRDLIIKTMADYQLDTLVYPHQKRLVMKIGASKQLDRNGIIASAAGFPAITVPAGFSSPTETALQGIPVGIEFLGRPWSEPLLIEIAYSYEQSTHHRVSPVATLHSVKIGAFSGGT